MRGREIMIASLREESQVLKNLIQEMESNPTSDWRETQYYHEILKKIETSLKRARRLDEEEALNSHSNARLYYHPLLVTSI